MERIDLILHPVRFRILEALVGETLTTQELADRLPDVPKSSIYRYIRQLLDGDMIAIDGTRPVRGVVEKTYRLDQPLRLDAAAVTGLSEAEHEHYFRIFAVTLMQGFTAYVRRRARHDGAMDMAADRAGYTETFFFATPEEFDQFSAALNEALRRLFQNQPGEGRRKHKLAFITHPDQ